MIIKSCPITKQDSEVKFFYSVDKNSNYFKKYNSFHNGVDIFCKDVYSLFDGVVIQVCKIDKAISVTVQYNRYYSVRYCNLKKSYYNSGQLIRAGNKLGIAEEFVHFELLTLYKGDSKYKVHIGGLTLYIQDPTIILNGFATFENSISPQSDYNYPINGDYSTEALDDISEMTESMLQELTDGVDPYHA